MKTEQQIINNLIDLHQKQIESLKKNDRDSLFEYKYVRHKITIIENVLELDVIN
jgi:hypothetical protein